MADNKPTLVKPLEEVVPIAKPSAFDLEKFKSKRAAAIANVETLQTGLPHHSLTACEHAKTLWVQATSRRDENIDGYKIDFAHEQDAFGDPKWPLQSLGELIGLTFAGRMIDNADHPALLRLIGARQNHT
jgi:hypothetical protein